MITEKINIMSDTDSGISLAAEMLKQGGTVAIPTETVYGLAANALDKVAVAKIFTAKGRPQDNPLIVHIAEISDAEPLVEKFDDTARLLAERFWPGPFTMILKRSDKIPKEVSAGLDTVALRMPVHPIARAIIKAAGLPIAAPSANLSGSPSPTTAARVIEDLDGKVDGIVVSSDCEVGVESTVITLTGEKPRLLRPGAVTLEQLLEILPDIEVDSAVLAEPEKDKPVASPGMKYKHYSPKCEIYLVEGSKEKYIDFVNSKSGDDTAALCFFEDKDKIKIKAIPYGSKEDGISKAQGLFEALRQLDEAGIKIAFAHAPEKSGVDLAVYNRLIRAAGFKVIKL